MIEQTAASDFDLRLIVETPPIRDVFAAGEVKRRASVIQSKQGNSVRFEIPETTRQSLDRWNRDPEVIGIE